MSKTAVQILDDAIAAYHEFNGGDDYDAYAALSKIMEFCIKHRADIKVPEGDDGASAMLSQELPEGGFEVGVMAAGDEGTCPRCHTLSLVNPLGRCSNCGLDRGIELQVTADMSSEHPVTQIYADKDSIFVIRVTEPKPAGELEKIVDQMRAYLTRRFEFEPHLMVLGADMHMSVITPVEIVHDDVDEADLIDAGPTPEGEPTPAYVVARFIDTYTKKSTGKSADCGEVYRKYDAWCISHNHVSLVQSDFDRVIRELPTGFGRYKTDNGPRWMDMDLSA